MNYEETGNALVDRILALGDVILTIDDPWKLFKVQGFDCGDLEPTLAQASWALAQAKRRKKEARG